MIVKILFKSIISLFNIVLGGLKIPTFGIEVFQPYIDWFYTFIDSTTSLIAFLIPRPVFVTSIFLAVAIHNLDHLLDMINFVAKRIPVIGKYVSWRDNISS